MWYLKTAFICVLLSAVASGHDASGTNKTYNEVLKEIANQLQQTDECVNATLNCPAECETLSAVHKEGTLPPVKEWMDEFCSCKLDKIPTCMENRTCDKAFADRVRHNPVAIYLCKGGVREIYERNMDCLRIQFHNATMSGSKCTTTNFAMSCGMKRKSRNCRFPVAYKCCGREAFKLIVEVFHKDQEAKDHHHAKYSCSGDKLPDQENPAAPDRATLSKIQCA